jgi:hypothetical protein
MIGLLIVGIVLVTVPLALILGFTGYIFIAFMKDDGMTTGIMMVALAVMGIGIFLIAGYFLSNAVAG